METDRFIHALAKDLEPVRPLARPWVRAAAWAAGTVTYLAVLVLVMSPRDDLDARLRDPWFLIEQGAALLTGITAGVVALATTVPGYRREIVGVPLAFAATWVVLVGVGALRDARLAEPGAVLLHTDWRCVWTVVVGAALPAVTMAAMLRRGVPLTPHLTAGLGGLAAAGLGNLGVCLFHPHSSNLVVLVWHCGTVLAIAACAGVAGSRLLHWPRRFRTLPSV